MRKLLLRERKEDELDINVTPMLDVIFIMLIFFVVTASFVQEAGIEIQQPQATSTKTLEQKNILVAISAANAIWINGRAVNFDHLRASIERLRAENPLASVLIQADQKAHANTLVKVMDAARLAGVRNMAISSELK